MASNNTPQPPVAAAPKPEAEVVAVGVKYIWVVSTKPANANGSSEIAFHENHPDHPEGSAFVSSDSIPAKIAKTELAEVMIVKGEIKEVPAPKQ